MKRIPIGDYHTFYDDVTENHSVGILEHVGYNRYLVRKCMHGPNEEHEHITLIGQAAKSFLTKCWKKENELNEGRKTALARKENTDF